MSLEDSLALKFRPKKLSDIVGQPIVVKAFKNAFKTKQLHHAYIFSGMYGSGKTTLARIVAAMENCENNAFKDPCGKCKNCREIFVGKSLEVKEMDAASNRSIDDIRDLQEELRQSPIQVRTRYVIIDEAHSLTGAAAEAALKLLEEPPKYVRFILATTEPQAFKETIHSRCIQWNFSKITSIEIFEHLKKISSLENIDIEEKALKIIAKESKGSVRNAMQNFQKAVNYAGEESIKEEHVIEAIGTIDIKLYFGLVESIIQKNYLIGFQIVNALFLNGQSVNKVIDGLQNHLNNILLVRLCKQDAIQFDITEAELKRYANQASKLNPDILLRMMSLVVEISQGVQYNLNPEWLFNSYISKCIDSK